MDIKRYLLIALVVLGGAAPAAAQNPIDRSVADRVRWTGHEQAADNLSTVLVAAAIGADTIRSFRDADPKRALVRQGVALGVTVGLAELTKRLVHRQRPDASDRLSFFSEHTALAFVPVGLHRGGSIVITLPIGLEAGGLRIAANKHWASDVAAGAAVGWLSGRIARRLP